MNLLLSDHPLPPDLPARENNRYIDLSRLKVANCIGCFGCWVKTPGKCVIRDDAVGVYPLIAQSENLLYVSRLYCGSFDVPMKTMLERTIPVQQAFLRLHHGETHHVQRDVTEKSAVILAWGDIPAQERTIFEALIARNAHNMLFKSWRIRYTAENELDDAVAEEVQAWENS